MLTLIFVLSVSFHSFVPTKNNSYLLGYDKIHIGKEPVPNTTNRVQHTTNHVMFQSCQRIRISNSDCLCSKRRPISLLHVPSPPEKGIFHAKLWLLQHPERLRIVIGSLNFFQRPTGEVLWYADLPRTKNAASPIITPFQQELVEFLQTCGYQLPQLDFLFLHDFTVLAPEVRLVSSIPGMCMRKPIICT